MATQRGLAARLIGTVIVTGALALGATGCTSASTDTLAAASREPTQADTIDEAVLADIQDAIDPETLRLQWNSPTASYYSAASVDPKGWCLVVVDSAPSATAACSASFPVTMTLPELELVLDPSAPDGEGWKKVGDDLWAKE